MSMQITNNAVKDINIKDIPERESKGEYQWSQGQESILLKVNDKVQSLKTSIEKINNRIRDLKDRINSLEDPSEQLIKEKETELEKLIDKKQDLRETLNLNLKEQKKYKDILHDRGKTYIENVNEVNECESKEIAVNKSKWPAIKTIAKKWLQVILVWAGIEAFMTASMYTILRNTRSINEVLFRSLTIACLVFATHVAKHAREKYGDTVYKVYVWINVILIVVMMATPIYLDNKYPANASVKKTSSFRLTNEQTKIKDKMNSGKSDTRPRWVSLYLNKYDYLPAAAGVMIGIGIYFIYGFRKEDQADEVQEVSPNRPVNHADEDQPMINRLINLRDDEVALQSEINRIKDKIQNLQNHPLEIIKLNNYHEQIDEKISSEKNKLASEEDKLEAMISRIESHLNSYEAEFMDILSRDEVDDNLITPEWPTHDDILTYYNINNKKNLLWNI